jgi:ATP-dependent protease HslVU (ClpYQ) peptidase subunit
MTIIAWDGTTLAADKMTSFGGLHGTTTKVHKIGDILVGGCGNTALIQEMMRWIHDGCQPDKFPTQQRNPQECASILVINKTQPRIIQYESTPHPIILHNPYWAIGSGRDFAMAAMFLGRTAKEAVEVACVLCNDCGNGVDTLIHVEDAQ